jgi:threonine dehydrogenase-like Zn-dependent dehydrogenase
MGDAMRSPAPGLKCPLWGTTAGRRRCWRSIGLDPFTTPKLLRLVAGGRLDPTRTHRYELDEMIEAYDTFADARPRTR